MLPCAVALVLVACAASGPPAAKIDEAAVKNYRDSGYAPANAATIESLRVSGPVTEAPWSVSLTRPADHAVHPLIIFLPSLGEDDTAPVQWCRSWAHAGYAVMMIQALADDAQVWSTADARSGDFERIARARYADDLMADRVARLSRQLAQIHQRSLRGEAGLQGLDWDHMAIAGADLGAFTVQTLVGAAPVVRGEAAGAWRLWPI